MVRLSGIPSNFPDRTKIDRFDFKTLHLYESLSGMLSSSEIRGWWKFGKEWCTSLLSILKG